MSQLGLVLALFLMAGRTLLQHDLTPCCFTAGPNYGDTHSLTRIPDRAPVGVAAPTAVETLAAIPTPTSTQTPFLAAIGTHTQTQVPAGTPFRPQNQIPRGALTLFMDSTDSPRHFVLIQADTSQAFYIRLGSQVYTSSGSRHLILAPLKDSTYTIIVGFPGQVYPEQRFRLVVHGRDFALILSREDGQWSLLDRKGEALVSADLPGEQQRLVAGVKKDDAFSRMMSAIVRDTAVMYNTYAVSQPDSAEVHSGDSIGTEASVGRDTQVARDDSISIDRPARHDTSFRTATNPGPDSIVLFHGHDTSATGLKPLAAAPVNAAEARSGMPASSKISDTDGTAARHAVAMESSVLGAEPSTPTGVVKLSEHRSATSLRMVFADHSSHPQTRFTDTIEVIIPLDSGSLSGKTSDSLRQRRRGSHSSTKSRLVDSTTAGHPSPRIDSAADKPNASPAASPDSSIAPGKSAIPFVNSDCHAFATDAEAEKLRIKMLGMAKFEDRLIAAHKVFKTKCFSTAQIRTLAVVFETEAARFSFLQAAYPYASDDQFPQLIDMFADPVFKGKFQTMTGRH